MARQLARNDLSVEQILNQLRSEHDSPMHSRRQFNFLRKSTYKRTNATSLYYNHDAFKKLDFSTLVGPYRDRPYEDIDFGMRFKTEAVLWTIPKEAREDPLTKIVPMTMVRLYTDENPEIRKELNGKKVCHAYSDAVYHALAGLRTQIKEADEDHIQIKDGIAAKVGDCVIELRMVQEPLYPNVDYSVLGPADKIEDVLEEFDIKNFEGMIEERMKEHILNSYVRKGIAYNPILERDSHIRRFDISPLLGDRVLF